MNTVTICGQIGTIKQFNNNTIKLSIATREKQNQTNWINCTAFNKTAEFIKKYFNKGKWIGITGHIKSNSYMAMDGTMKYAQDVIIENVQFIGKKETSQRENIEQYENIPMPDDEIIEIEDDSTCPW